jgi:DNA polymerase III sliding clamp (beta) subunit (PCNA family)
VSEGWAGYPALEFRVRRAVLVQLATQAMVAVPSTPQGTLQVHGCFQVTVRPGFLQLTATNTVLTVFASTEAVDADGAGVLYLPAKRLKEVVSAAPDGEVVVAAAGSTAVISAGKLLHWDLAMPPPNGYSELPDLAAISFSAVPKTPLLAGLKMVQHAACRDAGRPHHHQVRLAKDSGAMFAAAYDGSQFARAPVAGFPFETCIPVAMLDELVGLLGKTPADEVEAGESDGTLAFRAGRIVLACQGQSSPFPDTDAQVIEPTAGNDSVLKVDREELLRAVHRVSINANRGTSALALIAEKDTLTVATRDDGGNRAQETVQATWGTGRRLLAVNWRFLADMAAAHPAAELAFRVGEDAGYRLSMLRLEDPDTGVIGIISQMKPSQVGY